MKQLAPVGPGGEALLDYAIYDAVLAGFSHIVLVIRESLRRDFDAHLAPVVGAGIHIAYAYQRLAHAELAPDPPPHRTRPWGTGFAVLAAAPHIHGPFAACNADDFYGRGAYAALARAMRAGGAASVRAFTVGYPIATTLSESGGVSRGICAVDARGALRRLTEGLELRRDGNRVTGRDVAGRPVNVALEAPVCTNLWGFPHAVFALLRERFAAFLASGPGLDREFYLSEAINDLIAAGRVGCTVIPTRERWLGVTFPADHRGVAQSLRQLVDLGVYPMRLWDAFPQPSTFD